MPGVEAALQRLLPIVPLLVSLGVHFVLVSFYHLYTLPIPPDNTISIASEWLPAFTFYHTILFLVGLWALVDKESLEAVVSYIVVVAFTILLDIIQLGLYFPALQSVNGGGDSQSARIWQFSAACAIMNLLFKPLSIALASLVLYIRAGGSLGSLGSLGGGGGSRDSYSTVHGSNEQPEQ